MTVIPGGPKKATVLSSNRIRCARKTINSFTLALSDAPGGEGNGEPRGKLWPPTAEFMIDTLSPAT